MDLDTIRDLADKYGLPMEDVLFIALNFCGIDFPCDYNRMRMGLITTDKDIFANAENMGVRDFYFALPINDNSPFSIREDTVYFGGKAIASALGATEDFCDSNYSRRSGTVLNINPNSRTSCRGCKFCYTGYQIPRDRKRMITDMDIMEFFEGWMVERKLSDLSGLTQAAVVTGYYDVNQQLSDFLIRLRNVLSRYAFRGEIFYLGSQITDKETLAELKGIKPFCYCLSLECFEKRDSLLRDKKNTMTVTQAFELMAYAKECGFRVNFSYVLGLEPLETVEKYFRMAVPSINSFPIVNTLQLHKYHSRELLDEEVREMDLEYFLKARKILEKIFLSTDFRPRVWENYRSLWYLRFADEVLTGSRTP